MYSRQHRTIKPSSTENTSAPNQFAPRPVIYPPKLEEVRPLPDQTTEAQAKSEIETPLTHRDIDEAIFTRQVIRPEPRGIQFKLQLKEQKNESEEQISSSIVREQPVQTQSNEPEQLVQQTLATTNASAPLKEKIREVLESGKPIDYNNLIAIIHASPVAERQEVLNDISLRSLINNHLGANATTVMSSLLEGSQQWKNPVNNDFYDYFVTRRGSGSLPNTASMNCWESILYAAYLAQRINADWIYQFYQNVIRTGQDATRTVWNLLGWSNSLPVYPRTTPTNGQLLFYYTAGQSYPGHVAISLGGEEAISLWNQPNNVDVVQRIKVTDLSGTVYIGNPQW